METHHSTYPEGQCMPISENEKQPKTPEASAPVSATDSSEKRSFYRLLIQLFNLILSQWLVLGLGLACLLAALFPGVASKGGAIRSEYSILYGAVAIIFFISGLQISGEKLLLHLRSWRIHIITQFMSFVITPAIILAVLRIILVTGAVSTGEIDISMIVGFTALGSLPTTISSNVVLTRLAHGDDAAAMVEVVLGNILGPFISPSLITLLLPHGGEFESWKPSQGNSGLSHLYQSVLRQVGLSVLIPLAVGHSLQWCFPVRVKNILAKFYLAKVSTLCLILLVWTTFSSCFKSRAFYKISTGTIICTVFLNLGLYFLFTSICFFLSRPPKFLQALNSTLAACLPRKMKSFQLFRKLSVQETIAVCFCGAAKTTGLGIPMVAAMWGSVSQAKVDLINIPVVLYTTEQIFFAQALVYVFQRYVRKNEEKDMAPIETTP